MSLSAVQPRERNVYVIEEYSKALLELQSNSKPLITMLTMLAEENIANAADVVEVITSYIKQTPHKLSVMYLIDSIVKNVGKDYIRLFSLEIVPVFSHVFETSGEEIRSKLYPLRMTWTDVFPASRMFHLDVTINGLDHAWPVKKKSQNVQNIHVNPRFSDHATTASHKSTGLNAALPKSTGPSATPHKSTVPSTTPHKSTVQSTTPHKSTGPSTNPHKSTGPSTNPHKSTGPSTNPHKSTGPSTNPHKSTGPSTNPHKSTLPNPTTEATKEQKPSSRKETKSGEASKSISVKAASQSSKGKKRKQPELSLPQVASQISGPTNPVVPKTRDPRLAKADKKVPECRDPRKLLAEQRVPIVSKVQPIVPEASVPESKVSTPKKSQIISKSTGKPKIRPVSMEAASSFKSQPLVDSKQNRKSPRESSKPYNKSNRLHPPTSSKVPVLEPPQVEPKKKFQIPKKKTLKQYQEEKRQKQLANQSVPEPLPIIVSPVHTRSPLYTDKDVLEPPEKKRRLSPPPMLPKLKEPLIVEEESNIPDLFGSSDIDLRGSSKKQIPPHPPFLDGGHVDSVLEPASSSVPAGDSSGRVLQRRTSFHSSNTSSWQKFREKNPEFLEHEQPSQENIQPKKDVWVRGDGHFFESRPSEPQRGGFDHIMENLKTQLDEKQISSQEYKKSMKNIWKMSEEDQIRQVQKLRSRSRWDTQGRSSWRSEHVNSSRGRLPIEWNHESRRQIPDPPAAPKPSGPGAPDSGVISVPLASEADLVAVDKFTVTHEIKIGEILRDMRNYGDKTVVLMEDCDPHFLTYQQCICDIVIDGGVYAFQLSTNDSYRQFTMYGELHQLKLGSPGQEIFINGVGYQCFFGGKPIFVNMSGQPRSVKLVGTAPQVIVDPSRNTDFLLGKIPLIINAKKVLPIYLDPRPQKFSINGHTHFILKFIDSFQAILINGVRFPVAFGKLPIWFQMGQTSVFLRFGSLPAGISPGKATVVGMDKDGRDLFPAYPVDNTVRPPTPPVMSPEAVQDAPSQPVVSQASIFEVPTSIMDENSIPGLAPLAPATEQEPVDLNSLLQSLMQKGMIPAPSVAPVSAEDAKSSPDNSDAEDFLEDVAVDPSTMFNSENLKKKAPQLIRRLYKGMQCATCGMRFLSENGPHYSKHLDWHFRQNRRQQDSLRKPTTRRLFLPMDQWYHYEEVEDDATRELSVFEKEAGAIFGQEETNEEINFPCVSASRDDAEHLKSCPQCHEKFDQIYDEEEEGYCYKNAIHMDGFNYHPDCHNDFLKIRERAKEMEIRKKVAQELREAELQRQRELQLQKEQEAQAEKEAEIEREKELKLQQEREAELQRLKEIQQEKEAELQREKDAELRREKEALLRIEQEAELAKVREAELLKEKEREAVLLKEQEAIQREKELQLQKERERLTPVLSEEVNISQSPDPAIPVKQEQTLDHSDSSTHLPQNGHIYEEQISGLEPISADASIEEISNINPSYVENFEDELPYQKVAIGDEPIEESEVEMYVPPDFQIPCNLIKREVVTPELEETDDFEILEPVEEVDDDEIEVVEEPKEISHIGVSIVSSLDGNVENVDPTVPLQQPAPVIKVNFAKSSNIAPSNSSKSKLSNGVPEKVRGESTEFVPPPFTFNPATRPAFEGAKLRDRPVYQDVAEESSMCSIM